MIRSTIKGYDLNHLKEICPIGAEVYYNKRKCVGNVSRYGKHHVGYNILFIYIKSKKTGITLQREIETVELTEYQIRENNLKELLKIKKLKNG